MEVVAIDPRDAGDFAAWFGVLDAVSRHDRPGEPSWSLREQQALALDGLPKDDGTLPDELRVQLSAVVGDRVLGVARLELPMSDNRHVAGVDLAVLPGERRRGVGSVLLAEATGRALAAGRSTLVVEVDEPPTLAGSSPGRAFAAHHGWREVLLDVRRDLQLPVPADRLDELEQRCRPHAVGYRLVQWRDRVPNDLLEGRADLSRRMSTDVPLGDLDWQEERWDAARVRREEELVAKQGRTVVAAGAVHTATGELVAYTDVGVPQHQPERVYQWNTIVRSDHRGHRLGMLVKLAVLRVLPSAVPQARYISTWNASSNRHMIAVNEALGFQRNGQLVSFQRTM